MEHKEYEENIQRSDLSEEERKTAEKMIEAMQEEPVPEKLEPQAIREKLEKQKKQQRGSSFGNKSWSTPVLAAACTAIVIGLGGFGLWQSQKDAGGTQKTAGGQTAQENTDSAEALVAEAGLKSADDYDMIYGYLQKTEDNGYVVYDDASTLESTADSGTESAVPGAKEIGSASDQARASADYSDTNVREEGVGEADVVKTDGSYLYILKGKQIRIVDVRGREMKEAGKIVFDSDASVAELYVASGKLTVFYTRGEYEETDSDGYGDGYKEYTIAETFDVSNPSEAKSLGQVKQSGNYDSVRINGDYCYLFSNYYVSVYGKEKNPKDYVPLVQGELLESKAVYMPQLSSGNQFLVVTAFSLKDPEKVLDSKAVLSSYGSRCYVSGENIYVYEYIYNEKEDYDQTSIRKISYKDGDLKGVAQVKVWGSIKDSFCIDEYDGKLRIVTTVEPIVHYDSGFLNGAKTSEQADPFASNALYILDEKLETIGKIEKLAPDEQVYSARFMGEIGYFVTYEQVDPLFSVDLSDPKKPKVLGALKIPGFSSYLHPYGEGKLLGIGMDADLGGVTNGVKLSMFDISDPEDVKEEKKEIFEDAYTADVIYNYKAALIDPKRNLIGFAVDEGERHYYVYSYDPENGFVCRLDKELSGYTYDIRGLYINDVLYLVEGGAVEAFDLNTFEKIDDIVL